jgi:hypothetical protein
VLALSPALAARRRPPAVRGRANLKIAFWPALGFGAFDSLGVLRMPPLFSLAASV